MAERTPLVLNVSGPYGVGKDSLLNAVRAEFAGRVYRLRTITTRHASGDADPSYYFTSDRQFEEFLGFGRWIENAQLGSSVRYASSLDEAEALQGTGLLGLHSTFAGPDGAGEFRKRLGRGLLSIGVLATGGDLDVELEELERRQAGRGRETEEQLEARRGWQQRKIGYVQANPTIQTVDGPMPAFDHVVVNRDLPVAIKETIEIVRRAFDGSVVTRASDASLLGELKASGSPPEQVFAFPHQALALGRVLMWGAASPGQGAVLPRQESADTSFHISTLWSFLRRTCFADETAFVLVRHGDELRCVALHDERELARFVATVEDGAETLAYLALQGRDIDGALVG